MNILQEADRRVQEEMVDMKDITTSGSPLPCFCLSRASGVMGDERTYANVIAIRAVTAWTV